MLVNSQEVICLLDANSRKMAHFGKDLDDFKGSRCVHIRSAEQTEHFTVYIITVTVGSYTWTVKHRYSEFHDLHEKLTASYKLDKSLLPPKKIFGNQTESFIKKRQRELEIYLQTIILYLAQHIPTCLAYFLDFDKYEIHGITQAMAEDLYNRGESLLLSREKYEVTTLQLYSLTERLKLPEPTCDSGDVKKDLGHILDYITRAKHLKVVSKTQAVGTSNIMMSKLPFDLTLFKSLQTLEICGCNFRMVDGLETVKQTLIKFEVHQSSSSMKEIFLQDAPHWRAEDGSVIVGYWDLVTQLNLSNNSFAEIHESIQLMPNVEKLNLSHNVIESIQSLQWLSQLTYLNMSHNNIRHLDSLHTKLGNIKWISLAHNQLESLHGFAKLFSLETLDVSHNKISGIEELRFVTQLPCLENLNVVGNSVTTTVDYRSKTLEMFGDRVGEVILDSSPPNQKELDTVAVLQALRKAKDMKITKKPQPKKNTSAVSLSDMYSQSPSGSLSDQPDGRNSSRNSSPAPGLVSRSVPSNLADWDKKAHPRNIRSSSPFSQDSVSSHNSIQEVEDVLGAAQETKASGSSATPSANGAGPGDGGGWRVGNDNNSNSNVETLEGDADNDDIYPHELVPEAHPFDLTIENPASIASTILQQSRRHKNGDTGQVSHSSPKTHGASVSLATTNSTISEHISVPSSSQVQVSTSVANTSPSAPVTAPSPPPPPPPPLQSSSTQELSCSQPNSTGSSQKRKLMSVYNAADLPSICDKDFVSWMDEQLLTSGDVAPSDNSQDQSGIKGRESIIDILWCYAEQLSEPAILFPCCAILTESKIFIEKLVGLESSFPGVPEMEPCSIVPIQNIQQLVLGQCHVYVRLEEAFVGKSGTFTLFGVEPQGVKRFVKKAFNVCSELDVMNCPDCVDLSVQSDLLKTIATREEQNFTVVSDRLAASILVRLKGCNTFCLLVLSENKVYCLDIDVVHWPPTSFETSPAESITCRVLHEFSIMDKISDIKLHPSEVKEYHQETIGWEDISSTAQFAQHELSLEVTLSVDISDVPSSFPVPDSARNISVTDVSQKHSSSITYMFTSAACRDLFLDRLTNRRAELAHRMSPNVREEPEGGNEQVPLADGQGHKSWSTTFFNSSPVSFSSVPSKPKTTVSGGQSDMIKNGIKINSQADPSSTVGKSSSHTSCKLGDRVVISESVMSDKSFGVISLTESDIYSEDTTQYQAKGSSTTYSTSPKDDLSVSPMSNFSRASISPPVGQEPERKNRRYNSELAANTSHVQQPPPAKADSLPSSFDWKEYYFKSPPNLPLLNTYQPKLNDESQDQTLTGVTMNSTLDGKAHSRIPTSVLEDIESSSEFDSNQIVETDHELYLKRCVKSFDLIYPLPAKLKPLSLMNGRELRKFFHSVVAPKAATDTGGGLSEELHYVIWSSVVPYTNPKQEITTLVMMSTHNIYLVSDTGPKAAHHSRPSWMTHSRNQSDSAITWKSQNADGSGHRKMVKPYYVFSHKDLLQVHVGLFDQCIRLTGANEHSVFTIATRDSVATETFIQKLKYILSLIVSSPMVERNRLDIEHDFYQETKRTKSTVEGIVYTHPSQINFIYPGEDAVRDILYLVNERISQGGKVPVSKNSVSKFWFYMLCYSQPPDEVPTSDRNQPRSVIITSTHFCLAEEDIVTYPLPDFVRGLPENPCHEIVDCRRIDSLKRITLYHGHPHWVCLTFLDEPEDIVVDVSMEHFSQAKSGKAQHVSPEVNFRLFVQNTKERDKMVQILDRLWKELVSQVGRILDINKIQVCSSARLH